MTPGEKGLVHHRRTTGMVDGACLSIGRRRSAAPPYGERGLAHHAPPYGERGPVHHTYGPPMVHKAFFTERHPADPRG